MAMIPPTSTKQGRGWGKTKTGKVISYDRENADAEAKLTAHLARYTNKPDYDNLPKAMNDIMTKLGYWKDDCIIASGITEKFWSATPGIYVKIEELKPIAEQIKKESGCHACRYADWDAGGCTCKLDGLLVWNPRRGCECLAEKE